MAAPRAVASGDLLLGELAKEGAFLALPNYVDRVQRHGMEEVWRSSMGGWYFEVAETYGYSFHTVATAASLLDRYLSLESVTKDEFMVFTVAAIFAASKLHESAAAPASEMCKIARFTTGDVLRAEATLLARLQWRVHAPTVYSMLHLMLNLLSESGDATRASLVPLEMTENAMFYAEISVHEAGFSDLRVSAMALACILLAAAKMQLDADVTEAIMDELCKLRPAGEHPLNSEVQECKTRLATRGADYLDDEYDIEVAALSGYAMPGVDREADRGDSPNCVSAPLMPRRRSSADDVRKRPVSSGDFGPEQRKRRAHSAGVY